MGNVNKSTLMEIIAQILEFEMDELTLDASLIDDLNAESLDLVDISFSLGKKLGIRLPTKTALIMAEDIFPESIKLSERGRLTELGARFLQEGPNKYSSSVAKEGASVDQIIGSTTVENWYNLCQFIADHPTQAGDIAVSEYIKSFAEKYELTEQVCV